MAPYDARAVANFFLQKDRPTQMKLHKLIYYAHGWHLGFRSQPLLDETLEAWRYGPVVPSIYREFGSYGAAPIDRLAQAYDPRSETLFSAPAVDPTDRFVLRLLKRVWTVYGGYSGPQLSDLTHAKVSPWSITRRKNPGLRMAGIPNELLREHFAERLRRHRDAG